MLPARHRGRLERAAFGQAGIDGKRVIHPRQLEPTPRAFRPSDGELAHARRGVEALGETEALGKGADGKMIDHANVQMARKAELAGTLELITTMLGTRAMTVIGEKSRPGSCLSLKFSCAPRRWRVEAIPGRPPLWSAIARGTRSPQWLSCRLPIAPLAGDRGVLSASFQTSSFMPIFEFSAQRS